MSYDDILIRIRGIFEGGGFDEAVSKIKGISNEGSGLANKINNSMNSVNNSSSNVWNNIKNGASSAFGAAKSYASDFMNSMQGMNGMIAGVLGSVGVGAVANVVVDTSAKAETNKILLKNMTQTKAGSEQLYKTIDNATNKTLVSMQQVIPAVNAFKAATSATEGTLNTVSPKVAEFGSYVYALTGSEAKAETAMFDLSKGIKGLYASLDQYGISEDALMKTGLWSGKEDDVEGYMAAVQAVTGSTDELMGTFTGLKASVGKMFSVAGKKLGETILPVLKDIMQGFMAVDKQLGGNLAVGILVVVGAIGLLLSVGTAASFLWPLLAGGAGVFAGTLSAVTGALGMNTTSMTLSAIANGEATISWNLLTTAMLANPMFWIAAVILGVAAAIVILKTQTDLLDSSSDKASKSMQTLNNRLEMLKGQVTVAENNIKTLKEKLDSLDKSDPNYEVTMKNYESEKQKLENIKKDIDEINHTKASYSLQIENAELDAYNRTKIDPKKLQQANVTQYTSGDPQNIENIKKAGGQLAYYNDLANKTTKTFNGLSDAELKTWKGKQLGEYSQKMSEIADIETKINKDINNGKEPSWLDQLALSRAKNSLDEMAGINPWDSEDLRVKKRKAFAEGDLSLINEGSILSESQKSFDNISKSVSKGWDSLNDSVNKGLKSAGDYITGAWSNTSKWFDDGKKWIIDGYDSIKQSVLEGAANLTKDIPLIGGFFEDLKNHDGDIGEVIKETINDIDWNKLGSDVGTSLINGIKSKIESIPIIGDIIKFLENPGGSLSSLGGGGQTPQLQLPQFTWPKIPNFSWPKLPNFGWPKLPNFSWPKIPNFSWPKLPNFSWPHIPSLNLANFVKGVNLADFIWGNNDAGGDFSSDSGGDFSNDAGGDFRAISSKTTNNSNTTIKNNVNIEIKVERTGNDDDDLDIFEYKLESVLDRILNKKGISG
jgi:hypothetical protein